MILALRNLRRLGYGLIGYAHLAQGSEQGHGDCLPGRSDCVGIHQNRDKSGAAAADLAVGQLESNDFGLPAFPKTVLIDSIWKLDLTLKPR